MTSQGATLACPICEYECAAWEDIRFHLHTRHPKSDLVDTLVVTGISVDGGGESVGADEQSADAGEESVGADTLIAR